MPTLDVSTHYLFWHNTESVTFKKYVNAALTATVTVTHALRSQLTRTERTLFASIESDSLAWALPYALMSSNEAKIGDTITDADSVVWSIINVEKRVWGTDFRCVCERQR